MQIVVSLKTEAKSELTKNESYFFGNTGTETELKSFLSGLSQSWNLKYFQN